MSCVTASRFGRPRCGGHDGLQLHLRGATRRICAWGRHRAAQEHGFSLTELLVTCLMMVFIVTAILNLLDSSSKIGQSDLARNQALNDSTLGFQRMVDEIRQAYQINCPTGGCTSNATTSAIDFDERVYEVPTSGGSPSQQDRRVAYNCSVAQPGVSGEFECVRYEAAATDSTDAVPLSATCVTAGRCTQKVLVQNLVSSSVFSGLATGTSPSGATRWVSGTATVYIPSNGSLSTKVSPYRHDVILTQSFLMLQLQFGQ